MGNTNLTNTTLINGCRVNNKTILEVGKFAILWNDFEFRYFDTNCKDGDIKKSENEFSIPTEKIRQFAQALFNWKYPYDMTSMEYVDQYLCPEDKARCTSETKITIEQFLDAVRDKNVENDGDLIVGCLITMHRFRNNMMHGIKSIWQLDEQYEVFKSANDVLESLNGKSYEEVKKSR